MTTYGHSNIDGTPADPAMMDWVDDLDHENARISDIESRAYEDMETCSDRWRDWLIDAMTGDRYTGDVARYITAAMNAHVLTETEDSIIARGLQAEIGQRLRNDYVQFCIAEEDDA
jgi:hypothetical protein